MVMEVHQLDQFISQLEDDEKSAATISKYRRDISKFFEFMNIANMPDKAVSVKKADLREFKDHLVKQYKSSSVNSVLVALNRFMKFIGARGMQLKLLKVQRQAFREETRDLTRKEYIRLIKVAEKERNYRLSYLMQTIATTGIRVSELAYITVEAAKRGFAEVRGKCKSRTIIIQPELSRRLLDYAKRLGIMTGSIFITRNGKPMDRSNIWSEMKALCQKSEVPEMKVFPHNLRHLFAVCFYNLKKDLVKLADVLGHSQIETTRIYTMTPGREHKKQIAALNLLL